MKEENRLRKRQEIVFDACYGNIHADRLVEIKVMFLNVPEEKGAWSKKRYPASPTR